MPEWIGIGVVASVNPTRREVRVNPARGRRHEYTGMTWARFLLKNGESMRCRVASTREVASGQVVLTMAPGVTRDNVALLRGAKAVLDTNDGSARADDAYEFEDLVGFAVVDEADAEVGKVIDAFETPAHGVVEVAEPDGRAFMLPVVEEVVTAVDIGARVLAVRAIAPHMVRNED